MALKAVVELLAMLLQVVWQAKPLDCKQEHPVYRFLQFLVPTGVLVDPAHPLLSMPQVESLFLIYFHQGTLPGTESRTLVNISEQRVAGAVVEGVGNNQFHPAIQGNIESIRVLKITRV